MEYTELAYHAKSNICSWLYHLYANFQKSYYNRDVSSCCVDRDEFATTHPLIVFDCSHQNDQLKNTAVDIRLEIETTTPVEPNTSCFCLILHDRLVQYNPLSNIVKKIVMLLVMSLQFFLQMFLSACKDFFFVK